MKKSKSLSLIEIIVVVAIISGVTAITIPAYSKIRPIYELSGQKKSLISNIRQAQENAVTTQNRHKIKINNNSYDLIKINDDTSEALVWTKNFSPDINVETNFLDSEIIFQSDGSITHSGEISLGFHNSNWKKISINTIGNIKE